jgi:TRAP-type C4-dicarboxylate transport system permease small subunit
MPRFFTDIPKFVVASLLVAAIVNLLIGVFLRYIMVNVTDWLGIDQIRFTWVEEVGEMLLAWLTLIGAAIGVRESAHFALHALIQRLPLTGQLWVERGHHVLIACLGGLAAWYGVKLCILNDTLRTPGLELNLVWLYASVVVGGILITIYAVSMIASPPPRDSKVVSPGINTE